MNYKSGFAGHDAMRNKAIKEFGSQMRDVNMRVPQSHSSPSQAKMRLYKKGGKVHGLTYMQTDLYIPKQRAADILKQTRMDKVAHKNMGGSLPSINQASLGIGAKKGGRIHHGHHRRHKADGGTLSEMGKKDFMVGKMASGLKHGGRAHHIVHKAHHKSEGGPMRGEHPTARCSYNNYESKMPGEHAMRKHFAEGGYAEGGKMYAAGGVGKIRHKQMTESGKPIVHRRKVRGDAYQ